MKCKLAGVFRKYEKKCVRPEDKEKDKTLFAKRLLYFYRKREATASSMYWKECFERHTIASIVDLNRQNRRYESQETTKKWGEISSLVCKVILSYPGAQ